jgi:hypothetical protein
MADTNSDEDVGYKRPPKTHRFIPGQSGNPKGRPKGARNLATDLREELAETIRIRESGRELRVSKQRAMIKSLVAAAVKGDVRATTALVSLCAKAFVDNVDDRNQEDLSPADARILEDFVDREIKERGQTHAKHRQPEAGATDKEIEDEA